MNTNQPTPELPFWLEALQHLRADQINVLAHLAKQGEQIEEMITEAIWQELDRSGLLDTYRKEHGLPEDWPFGEQDLDDAEEEQDDETDQNS